MAVRITTDYDEREQELLNTLESTYSTDTARSTVTALKRLTNTKWNSVTSLTALSTEIAARENLPGYGISTALYNGWLELLYANDKVAKGYTDADLVATARSILKNSDYSRYEYIYKERKPFMDRVSAANEAEEAARAHVFGRVKQSGTSVDTTKTDSSGTTTLSTPKDDTTKEDGTSAATTPEGSSGTTVKSGTGVSTSGLTRVVNDGESPYDPALLDKRPAWMDTNIEYHRTKSGTSFLVDSAIIKRYYSVIDAEVYFGNEYVEDIHDINWVVNQNVLPLFGYNSYTYDEVARGNRLISGNFTINFTSPNYLFAILEAANSATASTITSLEDYTVPALTAGSEITYRKNTLGSKISGHHAPLWPQTFDIDIIFGENSAAGKPVHIILTGCALQACQQVLSASATGSPPVVMEQYSFVGQDIRTVVTSAIGISTVTDAGTAATNSDTATANSGTDVITSDTDNPTATSTNSTGDTSTGSTTGTGGSNTSGTGSSSDNGKVLKVPVTSTGRSNSSSNKDDDDDEADSRSRTRSAADTSTYKAPTATDTATTDTTVTPTDTVTDTAVNISLVDSDTSYFTITDPDICRLLKKLKDTGGVGLSPEEQQTLGDYLNRVKGQTVNNDGVYFFNYTDPDTGEVFGFTIDDPTIATIASGKLPYQAEGEEPSVWLFDDSATCLSLSRLIVQKLPPEKQKSLGRFINVCKQATYTTTDSAGNNIYHFRWIKPANSYTGLSEPIEESFECNDAQIAQLMSGEYPYELNGSVQDDDRIYTFLDSDVCNLMAIWQDMVKGVSGRYLTKNQQETLGDILDAYKLQTYYVSVTDEKLNAWVGEQDYYIYYYYSYPETAVKTLFCITYSALKGLINAIYPYLPTESTIPEDVYVMYIVDAEHCKLIAKVHKNPCGLTVKEQKTLGELFHVFAHNNATYWDGKSSDKTWYYYYKHPETGTKTLFSVKESIIDSWREGKILYDPDYAGDQYLGHSEPDTDLPDMSYWPRVESTVIGRLLDRYIPANRLGVLNLIEQKTLGTYLDGIKDEECSEEVKIANAPNRNYFFTYDSEYYKVEYKTFSVKKTTLEYMATLDPTDDGGTAPTNILNENTEFYTITDTKICGYLDTYIQNEEGLKTSEQKTLGDYLDRKKRNTYQNVGGWYYFYYRSSAFHTKTQVFTCDDYIIGRWQEQALPYNPDAAKTPNEFIKYIPNGGVHTIPVGNKVVYPSVGITVRYDGFDEKDKNIHYATVEYIRKPEPAPTPKQLLDICIGYGAVTYTEGATYDCTYYSYNNGKSFKLSYFQTS